MELTYAQTNNLLYGLNAIKQLNGHTNNFSPALRLAIIHNLKQCEKTLAQFNETLKELVKETPEVQLPTPPDAPPDTVLLDTTHELTKEFLAQTITADIRRMDFAAINTETNHIAIDAVWLLYDILDNVEIPDELLETQP